MWEAVLSAIASLAGGAASASGGQAAANATTKAAEQQLKLQQQQYNDARNLLKPNYLTSGAATNLLASQFGIAPQNYEAAYGAGTTGADDQWLAYLKSDPALEAEWARLQTQSKNTFTSPQEYAQWHYNTYGKAEGRQLPQVASAAPATSAGGTGGTTSGNPLSGFWASPFGELATKNFLSVDTPQIQGAFATGGKALSGAATKALYDRGQSRAEGAYTNYLTGLQSLASGSPTSQIVSSGQNFANNAGTAVGNIGTSKANALTSAYSGWGNGINGAINSLSKIWNTGGTSGDPSKSAYPGYY